jgi:D-3-phosphoglycerate dehydrogenase
LRTLKEDPQLLRNITPAAELSWALLMACARRLKGAFAHVDQGLWVREEFPGIMLNGRVLGLIGCGRIGGWMARYAQAFGMQVVAHDPHQFELPAGVTRRPLAALLQEADFVSVHVHLSDETRGLLSRELLEACKPGLIVINTSRGAIVDERALLDGLRSGRIGAVGVDVLDGEPEISAHPLVEYARQHENMLITPHCGGFSPDAVRVVCEHAARKILEVFAKQ